MDKHKPIVSVCCLVYNHEPFLRECFEGFVMQQTTFPIEILVHDDASTDHSADIIREYTVKYPDLFKPIYQTENQYSKGVDVFSINVSRAKGKYIAICEGDDYWTDPMKLQMQVDIMENNQDVSMVFHRAKVLMETRHSFGLQCFDIEDRNYSPTELFETWKVATASILYRKTCNDYPIKGSERMLNGDIFLVEKCAHTGFVRGLSKTLSVYRVHDNGVTYSNAYRLDRQNKYPEHIECIKENFPLISEDAIKQKLIEYYIKRINSTKDKVLIEKDKGMLEIYKPGYLKQMRIVKRRATIKKYIKKILLME